MLLRWRSRKWIGGSAGAGREQGRGRGRGRRQDNTGRMSLGQSSGRLRRGIRCGSLSGRGGLGGCAAPVRGLVGNLHLQPRTRCTPSDAKAVGAAWGREDCFRNRGHGSIPLGMHLSLCIWALRRRVRCSRSRHAAHVNGLRSIGSWVLLHLGVKSRQMLRKNGAVFVDRRKYAPLLSLRLLLDRGVKEQRLAGPLCRLCLGLYGSRQLVVSMVRLVEGRIAMLRWTMHRVKLMLRWWGRHMRPVLLWW